jgi:hypothetical protein
MLILTNSAESIIGFKDGPKCMQHLKEGIKPLFKSTFANSFQVMAKK